MDYSTRLEACDERNWVYNGSDFPSVVFLAHYFPFTLTSARNILSKHEKWLQNEDGDYTEAILNEMHSTIPDDSLLKPRDVKIAENEFETAKEVAKVLESNGGEVGSGCDQEWNPFRKDIDGEFDVMKFLKDCGVSDDYLKGRYTEVKSKLRDFIEFFNEKLEHDYEGDQLLDLECTLEEAISATSEMSEDVQYKETVTNYLKALSILYSHSKNVFYTQSGIYTSRGIDVRFLFAHKPETNTVFGCFQVLYLS